VKKILLSTLLALALAAPAFADDKAEMEAFMAAYLERWNAHDADTITANFYRFDAEHRWSTAAGLKAEFDRLKSEGYDKSDILGIVGCAVGPNAGQVELRFIRRTTDGGFMPPKDRTSIYTVRKFADGWRVTSLRGLPAGERMSCPLS